MHWEPAYIELPQAVIHAIATSMAQCSFSCLLLVAASGAVPELITF